MPTSTYDLIASNVLTSSASSVTFSSIPATYRDLVLVGNPFAASSTASVRIQFNSDTGNNYNFVAMRGNGTDTASYAATNDDHIPFNYYFNQNTTRDQIGLVTVFDYSATDKHKSTLTRNNKASTGVEAIAGRWASTSAITSLTVFSAVNFAAGSTFYLYGIVS